MRRRTFAAGLASLTTLPQPGAAQKKYDTGASDTEIRLGQTMPYGGPASASGTMGRACVAYFDSVNKAGGINGRKIRLISLDDGFLAAKGVELTRQLVERDGVLFIYGSLGVPTNAAVQKYLNGKKIPQLFLTTGASRFNDPKNYPWTMPTLPSYSAEGAALARYVLRTAATPRIAVIYQNDDLGKDFIGGFKNGLGEQAKSLLVSEQAYEVTDPTIDSQVIAAKGSGANVLYFAGTQKFGAMQIRARHDLGWKPLHLVCSISSSVDAVLKPAGLDRAEGLISTAYTKDPGDPTWANDAEVRKYLEWVKANLHEASASDPGHIVGYMSSSLVAYVLAQAKDNLTRENILEVATHLDNPPMPMLLPGISVRTTPNDYSIITKFQMQQFRDGRWVRLGDLIDG